MPGTGPQCGGAEGVIAMRRAGVIVALGALLGMCGGAGMAAPAFAGGRGDGWQIVPVPPGGVTLPADFCGFPVHIGVPVHKEFVKILKASDGTVITLTTGSLRLSWTNVETGKTITENESGPAKMTTHPDGSVTVAEKGRNGPVLAPADAARFGLPPLSETAGLLTATIAPDGTLTSLSLHGHVLLDTCVALS
jgi:hypothetical protein